MSCSCVGVCKLGTSPPSPPAADTGSGLSSLLDMLDKTIAELDLASPSMPGDWSFQYKDEGVADVSSGSQLLELCAEVDEDIYLQRRYADSDDVDSDREGLVQADSVPALSPRRKESTGAAESAAILVALGYTFAPALYFSFSQDDASTANDKKHEAKNATQTPRESVVSSMQNAANQAKPHGKHTHDE
ncbi:hypothetical protein EXIGLDRAFT_717887 [Exidia glandulosa HHB12029]|uniref:Uncharacterized protein n=1 Tax=Exidia glandulosa HHB12029 TaxID=1314781 RepID=A0A165P085_EXIGL|nr:hypothetical protein EXIGLDRAFT_717887 [Exidia glandulosa HHB12029]